MQRKLHTEIFRHGPFPHPWGYISSIVYMDVVLASICKGHSFTRPATMLEWQRLKIRLRYCLTEQKKNAFLCFAVFFLYFFIL